MYLKNQLNCKLNILFSLVTICFLLAQPGVAHAQPVTKIVTDFKGYWVSKTDSVNAIKPNDANHLLAFKAGTKLFSTGVNDEVLGEHNEVFTPGDFRALPIASIGKSASSSTFVGIGKRYGGVHRVAGSPSLTRPMEYYLTDGVHGLDLSTAVYNIPKTSITYKVDEFSIAAIGDGMPDIIASQVGAISSTLYDTFKFVDINGATVGEPVAVNFSGVTRVGTYSWAFFNASASPMTYNSGYDVDSTREMRLTSFDLDAFKLNNTNVGRVSRFVHVLSGESDEPFMAYNTTALRALTNTNPACDVSSKASMWLRANSDITTSSMGKVKIWNDQSERALHVEQTDTLLKSPELKTGAGKAFNYNPFVDFNNGQWMGFPKSAVDTFKDFDIYLVARPGSTAGNNKIIGFSRNSTDESGAGRGDFPSLNLNNTGNIGMGYGAIFSGTSTQSSTATGLWQVNYKRGDKVRMALNGRYQDSMTVGLLDLGGWYTQLGDGAPGDAGSDFDVAEIIVFPTNSTEAKRRKTASYLAVKYGLTLPYSYLAGDSVVIWDYSNATYNNRIFGIGRQDCQGLSQKQSTSLNDPLELLTIGRDTIAVSNKANFGTMADNQFLLWGDNNGTLAASALLQAKTVCLKRINREWRLERTGNFISMQKTQVKVKVDEIAWAEGVEWTGAASNYFLLIDRDGNNGYTDPGDDTIVATKLEGGYAYFDNVKWDTDGSELDYFTLALRRANTPVVAAITGDSIVCVGTTKTLSNTSPLGIWHSSNTAVATIDATGIVTGNTAGNATISYTVSNGISCETVVTKNIRVAPLPAGTIAGGEYCQGDTAQLTFTATGGVTPYSLIINGITYSPVTSGVPLNISPIPSATATYNLTQITDAKGCVRTAP